MEGFGGGCGLELEDEAEGTVLEGSLELLEVVEGE